SATKVFLERPVSDAATIAGVRPTTIRRWIHEDSRALLVRTRQMTADEKYGDFQDHTENWILVRQAADLARVPVYVSGPLAYFDTEEALVCRLTEFTMENGKG